MLIGVLGAGSWGSALAIAMSHIAPVKIWSRDRQQVEQINTAHINPNYLDSSIKLPYNVSATNDFQKTLLADLLIIATPCMALRSILSQLKDSCQQNTPDMLWTCKGFETGSGLLPHQIVNQILPNQSNLGGLLGPSFAKEVALGLPTAITITSSNLSFSLKWVQKLRHIPNFRVYANEDLMGSEIGAAVKNVMAIATGIADGLNFGYNARAALITRCLNEIKQLVNLLGGRSETIYGLTGVGDLILTCTGDLSRNRIVGLELARGHKIDVILASLGHVAEGVTATKEVYNLIQQLKLSMPIVESVYKIIYENADIATCVFDLLSREPKLEFMA